jgi:LacI family transcriptional regulator
MQNIVKYGIMMPLTDCRSTINRLNTALIFLQKTAMDSQNTAIIFLDAPDKPRADVRHGFLGYCRQHRLDWEVLSIDINSDGGDGLPGLVADRSPVAIVGFCRPHLPQVKWAEEHGLWVVTYGAGPADDPRRLSVHVDLEAVARLAAHHLRDRGFRQVACISGPHEGDLVQRCKSAFLRHAATLRLRTDWYHTPDLPEDSDGSVGERLMADWLRSRPMPLGVFCHQDGPAHHLRGFCRRHAFRVPEEIGILGVDDDPYICERELPQLSSVVTPWQEVGRQMGLVLHRALTGGAATPLSLLTPVRVHERASTVPPPPADPVVAKAISLVRRRLQRPPSVDELARNLGVSERTLHRRFLAATGLTPQRYGRNARLHRAAELLEGEGSIADIAAACGFASAHAFGEAFKRVHGVPPTRYRAMVTGERGGGS